MEGSAWDDEWYLERTPQGYWADFFDPAWESMLRSAKIFDDENMPFWWQNRFRAMGFYIPLIFFFSRYAIQHVISSLICLSIQTYYPKGLAPRNAALAPYRRTAKPKLCASLLLQSDTQEEVRRPTIYRLHAVLMAFV